MPSDRDRLSFDARQRYRSVVAQQGRVMVPADFNEAQEIAEYERRAEALDYVGPGGSPDDGYLISLPAPAPAFNFQIHAGTVYVGGERTELGVASDGSFFSYFNQLDWLDPAPPTTNPPTGEYILLTLRKQEMTATEDSNLKDVALGGPDTTARTRIVQQIERNATTATDCDAALKLQQAAWTAGGQLFDPATMELSSLATLKVGFETVTPPPTPCDPVAQGGYLGAENQLIRVRISAPDVFVWGFDNASFLYRVKLATDNRTLTLDSPPVDSFHFPRVGQAVEILRTQATLADGEHLAADVGQVFTLTEAYVPETETLRLPTPFTASAGTPQLFMRVWATQTTFTAGTAAALPGTGIEVTLNAPGGVFHIGDFWAFAVRPSTPVDVYPKRYLSDQPPDGPREWVCPLAIITWTGETGVAVSCRQTFDNLVELTKRKTGASCCTVVVTPEVVSSGTTLQAIVDSLGKTQSTICLQPGTYHLPVPLTLSAEHSGLTLEGCHPDVILVAGEDKAFLHGLVVLNQADNVTLRGLRFQLPVVGFEEFGGRIADRAIEELLGSPIDGPDLRSLKTGIGIRVAHCADLTIEHCTFDFQQEHFINLFEAGIFAVGDCQRLDIRHNQFAHAGGQVPLPSVHEEFRFGVLMTPTVLKIDIAGPASGATSVEGVVLAALLDRATILDNTFVGLTAAGVIYAEIGDLRIESNTVRGCYSGFQIFELHFQRHDDSIGQLFTGWADYPFAVGSCLGQGFPPPPGVDLSTALPGGGGGVIRTQVASTDLVLIGMLNLDSIFGGLDQVIFQKQPRAQTSSVMVAANDIDAVLANSVDSAISPSGTAFAYWGDRQDGSARLVLSGNSMRSQLNPDRSLTVAAVVFAERGALTGNVILNELSPGAKNTASLVAGPASTQLAITGNTLRGTAFLPPHAGQVAPFDRWDPLNLIVTA